MNPVFIVPFEQYLKESLPIPGAFSAIPPDLESDC